MHLQSKVLFVYILVTCCTKVYSQSLDKIGKKDMMHAGGGLSYSSIFYNAKGIPGRRLPFTWFLNGNVSTSFLDITLPFTFSYSNNQIAYTQPVNIQSFNPTYKWVKGYAGITSMNFSQYTLTGHIFSGAGIELTPKNFTFAAMYGRLKKAVEFDLSNNSDAYMSYKRIGWGSSAAYEKNGHGMKLVFFTAKDDPRSLLFLPVNTTVTPMQNTAISISAKTNLYKKLKVEVEYALSGLTRSLSSPEEVHTKPANKLPYISQTNATSQFFDAFKSSVGYNYKFVSISLGYERIAPEYRTLGGYYFNNDLENITVAPAVSLLKGKLNVSCNTGIQRNNLDNSKLSTSKRWVGSLTASYVPTKSWNFTSSYSNFSTYTKQKPQSDPFYQNALDTLDFYHITQSAMLSSGYNFGTTTIKHIVLLSLNHQVTGQNQGNISDPKIFGGTNNLTIPARVLNSNIGHTISFTTIKTSISTSANANYSQLINLDILYFGPNLNVSRAIANNTLRITIGSSYNQVLNNSKKVNEIFNHRIAVNYAPKFSNSKNGKVAMNISASYLQKLKTTTTELGFSEFTGNFGINYNF